MGNHTNDWNPESKSHRQRLKSSTRNLEFYPQHRIQNPRLSWIPLHLVRINTGIEQKEMQTWCQQRTKSLKEWRVPSTSLIIPSKWTSCWMTKWSSNCLRSILSQLCISVPLSTSFTDFTVKSKFSANRRCHLQCFSWLKHWTKRFCGDFSRSVANRMQVITTNIHQNTLINGMILFFFFTEK